MNWLQQLTLTGTPLTKSQSERRNVILANIINLSIFGLGTLLFSIYLVWYYWNFIALMTLIVSFSCLINLWITHLGYNLLSRVIVCHLLPLATTFISLYTKIHEPEYVYEYDYFNYRFFILLASVLPSLLFSLTERNYFLVVSIVNFSILMLYDPVHNWFGVPYPHDASIRNYNYYFNNVVIIISYLGLAGMSYFLKNLSEKTETEHEKTIEKLQKQTAISQQNQNRLTEAYKTIEEQRDILVNQNQNLSTELVFKNKALTEANTELIKYNSELMQFSYTVSHNLRGPVASLMGLMNLATLDNIDYKNEEMQERINKSIIQLDHIIQDLSKIIDIRNDIFQIRQKIVLSDEMRQIKKLLEKEIENLNVEIFENFSTSPEIYSVKPMINSIFFNLVSNSIKYRSKYRKPRILISIDETDEFYRLIVEDNGMGIDLKSYKGSIFKLYKRFHQHTEGKGLGLYLVKLQTEALGGFVEVDSELDKFTKFTVYLKKPINIERQVLYSEESAEIFYDAKMNATGIIWKSTPTSQEFRDAIHKSLDFLKAYRPPNYISDLRKQGTITPSDQEWIFSQIIPEYVQHGMKRIAVIKPETSISEQTGYVSGINDSLKKHGAIQRTFYSFMDAQHWIESEDK